MISPIHVMYVDIMNKDFQKLAIPIFKNLCHSLGKGVSRNFQPKWHDVQFIKTKFGDDYSFFNVI